MKPSRNPGNRTARRYHWPLGKPRNPTSPATTRLLTEARKFFEATKLGTGIANPYSVKRCAAVTGINSYSLRRYLAGRYTPAPDKTEALRKWLRHAKSAARKDGTI